MFIRIMLDLRTACDLLSSEHMALTVHDASNSTLAYGCDSVCLVHWWSFDGCRERSGWIWVNVAKENAHGTYF